MLDPVFTLWSVIWSDILSDFRLKEQEQLWQQQQANGGKDSSTQLRNREQEELMQIEGMLKDSAKREDEKKIQEHIVNEDLIPFNQASQQQGRSSTKFQIFLRLLGNTNNW